MATAPSPAVAASARASAARPRAGRLAPRAALPADGRGDGFAACKELGLYSLKKRIEDAVIQVEMTASSALEWEEARRIKQEELLRGHNLWDNPAKSHETLSALADAIRVVDHLKDLQYKLWAEKLFGMYTSWARKHGCKEGLVEKIASTSGHIQSAAMEIESEYMFGTLSGEKGIHRMIYSSADNSGTYEALSARVDIIPVFLDRPVNLHLDDNDLEISPSPSEYKERDHRNGAAVRIQHIPSGATAESSGERSYFANKLKAMSRLKAKLLVMARELRVSDVKMIKKQAIEDKCNRETRRYTFGTHKLVHDLNTGIQLSDLNSVMEGDILSFIRGRIISRHG